MRKEDSARSAGASPGCISLGPRQRRIIFREMVKAELQAGLLRHSKRRQLMRYASKMGLPEFEAHLIIAQAQHRDGQLESPRFLSPDEVHAKFEEAQRYSSTLKKIVLTTTAAAVLNVLMILWLFY